MRGALAIAACAACNRPAAIASCDDDLRGVYASGAERWMILDHGATLEVYPVFRDGAVTAELVVAPRVIDLARAPGPPDRARPQGIADGIDGTLRQRFMRRAQSCEAEVAVRVTRCAGTTLEIVLADPSPPLAFSPCQWPGPAPSRVVRWQRE